MNICLIGPARSGKSTLAHYLSVVTGMPTVDTGQVVRLTATPDDKKRLNKGQLSQRGGKGTGWVNTVVQRAVDDEPHIIVGYPRSKEQFEYAKNHFDFRVVCVMASPASISRRPTGGRSDNASGDIIDAKHRVFYGFFKQIWPFIDMFVTTDGVDRSDASRVAQVIAGNFRMLPKQYAPLLPIDGNTLIV